MATSSDTRSARHDQHKQPMTGSHLYQHSIRETSEDTTSSYSDLQHTLDRKLEQSHYTKDGGTSLTTTLEQKDHTLGSNGSISTNSTERVSHQTMNKHPNRQTKNQQHQDQNQRTPVMTSQHNDTHRQLSRSLHHQQHQSPATHTMEENPESHHLQTNITLALLLLARNNNRPQQIWRLRLLQL
jgi:hypothetical protein